MALKSVATCPEVAESGSEHDIWLAGGSVVLTIELDRNNKNFPPDAKQCPILNEMIQGLARAAKSVIYQAMHDGSAEPEYFVQPIESIADTIIMLSQLSAAVQSEASQ
ncbi:MAG: hypothetical protein J0L89_08415 [Xanthomonadales bacterium]|nr:hypothetical protein [Xanthomonadales bacterium]